MGLTGAGERFNENKRTIGIVHCHCCVGELGDRPTIEIWVILMTIIEETVLLYPPIIVR